MHHKSTFYRLFKGGRCRIAIQSNSSKCAIEDHKGKDDYGRIANEQQFFRRHKTDLASYSDQAPGHKYAYLLRETALGIVAY